VGLHSGSRGHEQTLVETWDGTSWSVTPSPNPGTKGSELSGGVSCASTTFCVAVGFKSNDGNTFQTLVETWNGTNWSVTPSPNLGDNNDSFASVSCPSATSCVAVGVHTKPSQLGPTLIETWNGTSWSVTHSPNPNTMSNNSFSGVS